MDNNFDRTPELGFWSKKPITINSSNVDFDPLFDDTETQHLLAGSPMIDAGNATAPALPSTDIDGEKRIMGAAVDIGADEYTRSTTTYRLTVTKSGSGSGTVTSAPAGITCGNDCTEDYAENTAVALGAAATPGSAFSGWSGGCTGTGACNLTMTAAKGVTATFVPLTLAINDASKSEGHSGASMLAFTVTLARASTAPVTLSYATANGTATAGSDYTTALGSLTFNAGETAKTINVSIIGDTLLEGNEAFFVNLTNPSGAAFADAQGQGTILNDDGGGVGPDFVITSIVLTPVTPKAGATFTATITVTNQGQSIGNASYLDAWTNRSAAQGCFSDPNGWTVVGNLAAGASKTLTITRLRSGAVGAKTFRAFVDGECKTAETNETNNQRTLSYTVVP